MSMSTTNYDWRQHYEAALLETDLTRLPGLIHSAQSVIDVRILQLQGDGHGTPDERDAIANALAGLRILQQEVTRG